MGSKVVNDHLREKYNLMSYQLIFVIDFIRPIVYYINVLEISSIEEKLSESDSILLCVLSVWQQKYVLTPMIQPKFYLTDFIV